MERSKFILKNEVETIDYSQQANKFLEQPVTKGSERVKIKVFTFANKILIFCFFRILLYQLVLSITL